MIFFSKKTTFFKKFFEFSKKLVDFFKKKFEFELFLKFIYKLSFNRKSGRSLFSSISINNYGKQRRFIQKKFHPSSWFQPEEQPFEHILQSSFDETNFLSINDIFSFFSQHQLSPFISFFHHQTFSFFTDFPSTSIFFFNFNSILQINFSFEKKHPFKQQKHPFQSILGLFFHQTLFVLTSHISAK